jgi:hypothetical protein
MPEEGGIPDAIGYGRQTNVSSTPNPVSDRESLTLPVSNYANFNQASGCTALAGAA